MIHLAEFDVFLLGMAMVNLLDEGILNYLLCLPGIFPFSNIANK